MTKRKANNKIKNKATTVTGNELTNLIIIIAIVCAVLLVFYFITVFINDRDKTAADLDDTVATIQYDEIIVGEILNRTESEYLVLVEKENDVNSGLYQSYLSTYEAKENALRVYTVDLGNIFNSNSLGSETIIEGDVEDFKFNDSTIIKVMNGKISLSYIGNEQIENYLKELIK